MPFMNTLDLMKFTPQDICGIRLNATIDPEIFTEWGHRRYFLACVKHIKSRIESLGIRFEFSSSKLHTFP